MNNSQNTSSLIGGFREMLDAADILLTKNKLVIPALVLIYTTIDVAAWVAYGDRITKVGKRFELWVNDWLLKENCGSCTSKELYAARCGILHRLNPTSDLSDNGTRKIYYSWGAAPEINLKKTLAAMGKKDVSTIHIDNLMDGLNQALVKFFNNAEKQPEQMERLKQCNGNALSHLSPDILTQYLAYNKSHQAEA